MIRLLLILFCCILIVSCKQKELVLLTDRVYETEQRADSLYIITKISNTRDYHLITVVQKDLYYVILTDRSINTKIPPISGIKIEIGNVYKLELHPILVDGKIKDKDFPTSVSYLRISEHTELYLQNYNPKFAGYFFSKNLKGLYYVGNTSN